MTIKAWKKEALIGGASNALDSIDGTLLNDLDFAFVLASNIFYIYTLDADSAAAESSPNVIKPDDNAGDKRWILQATVDDAVTNAKLANMDVSTIKARITAGTGDPEDATVSQINTILNHGWKQTVGTFTAAPASTSTLTMTTDLTASILVGMSLQYAIGGVTYYGRVAAIAANLLTVNGAPLGGNVTALYYDGGIVNEIIIDIPGLYEDASNTALIASDRYSSFIWKKTKSYLVYFSVWSRIHDTGTHGQASVRINGTEVHTTAGGPTIAADATDYPTVVDIATAAYDINDGEAFEITCIKGGGGVAQDLRVLMIFVTP